MGVLNGTTWRLWVVGMLIAFLNLSGPTLQAQRSEEYAIKAAFIYNIIQFVTWPDDAFKEGEPFVISVLGQNPFSDLLESIVDGQTINDRQILIKYPGTMDEAAAEGSNLIFIPRSVDPTPALEARLKHVLLVGDVSGFAARGGTIGLVRERNRVRLEVNRQELRSSGLRASSRLLGVATLVETEVDPS